MEKFDLKSFDKVLVRDDKEDEWECDLFVSIVGINKHKYRCLTRCWIECIPYEGNEHLLGTTNNYKLKYKPKDGDFIVISQEYCIAEHIAIFKGYVDFGYINTYVDNKDMEENCFYKGCSLRLATEEEKQQLLEIIHKKGKKWNSEKKCVEDIWIPKDGDFIKSSSGFLFIYNGIKNRNFYESYCGINTVGFLCGFSDSWTLIEGCTKPTVEEINDFIEKLHSEGKDWDSINKRIITYKWKPKNGDIYYYITTFGKIVQAEWFNLKSDQELYELGNCFETEAKAIEYRDKIEKVLKNEY